MRMTGLIVVGIVIFIALAALPVLLIAVPLLAVDLLLLPFTLTVAAIGALGRLIGRVARFIRNRGLTDF